MPTVDELFDTFDSGIYVEDSNYPHFNLHNEPIYVPVKDKVIGSFDSLTFITGERNVNFVGFILPRYVDSLDLTTGRLYVHYETDTGGGDSTPCNVSYSEEKVRLLWNVPGAAVDKQGIIRMMIYATGSINEESIVWKTLPATKSVADGLAIGGGIVPPDNSWYEQFVARMESQITAAQNFANDAKVSKDAAETAATTSTSTLKEMKDYVELEKASFQGYSKRGTDSKYGNAILGNTTGTQEVILKDAYEAPVLDLEVFGKSGQENIAGEQLFDLAGITFDSANWFIKEGDLTLASPAFTYMSASYVIDVLPNTAYTISGKIMNSVAGSNSMHIAINAVLESGEIKSNVILADVNNPLPKTYTTPADIKQLIVYCRNRNVKEGGLFVNLMVNEGRTALPWRPYVGGKKAPNPYYPQDIISVGHKSTGKQLFDPSVLPASKPSTNITSIKCENEGYRIIFKTSVAEAGTPEAKQYRNFLIDLPGVAGEWVTLSYSSVKSNVPNENFSCSLRVLNGGVTSYYSLTMSSKKLCVKIPETGTAWLRFLLIESAAESVLAGTYTIEYFGVQVQLGIEATEWEPYTAGKKSPSVEYPSSLNLSIKNKNMTGPLEYGEVDFEGNEKDNVSPLRSGFIIIDPKKTYSFSRKKTFAENSKNCMARVYDKYKKFLGSKNVLVNTALSNIITDGFAFEEARYIRLVQFRGTDENFDGLDFQMEEGNKVTSYEPPILQKVVISLTEPLFGVGDVQDRIMCKNGEWGIERNLVHLSLDGSADESWVLSDTKEATKKRFITAKYVEFVKTEKDKNTPIKGRCNSFPIISSGKSWALKEGISSSSSNGQIYVYLEELSSSDIEVFKKFLAEHPIDVVFENKKPVWEPFLSETQLTLNNLVTQQEVCHIEFDEEVDLSVTYIRDSNKVIEELYSLIASLSGK